MKEAQDEDQHTHRKITVERGKIIEVQLATITVRESRDCKEVFRERETFR